jgi:DNA-binding transcriptional LysR family regulator
MELQQLRYAVQVAHHLNFSKAAAELFVTQPNLSHQVLKLETEIGVSLFERKTRSVKLTPAGEKFVDGAKKILTDLERLSQSMDEYRAAGTGEIRIGTLPFSGNLGLTPYIPDFQKGYPGIRIKIVEMAGSNELIRLLLAGSIDVACGIPQASKDIGRKIKIYPIFKGHVVLITNAQHRFLHKQPVSLADAAEEFFILPPVTHSMRELALNACRECGFEPKIACECSQLNTLFNLVAKGLGIAFVSSQFIDSSSLADIRVVPFEPRIERTIDLAIREDRHQLPVIAAFRDFMLGAIRRANT